MDHGKIVSRGWEIGWKHKWLYGLGALAALTSGIQLGGSQGSFDFMDVSSDPNEIPPFIENSPFFTAAIEAAESGNPAEILSTLAPSFAIIGSLLIVTLILAIIFWFVGLGGRAGLILSVSRLEDGEKGSFSDNLREGFSYIMPLFLMKVVIFILSFFSIGVLMLLTALMVGGAASGDSEAIVGMAIMMLCAFFCLIFPFLIVLNYVDAYAFRGIVLQGQSVMGSIGHGWSIFRKNLGDNLLLGLIFGILASTITGLIGLIVAPVSLLFANPLLEYFLEGTISSGATVSILFGSIILTALMAALTGVVVTWQSAGFTLAYREFTGMVKEPLDPIGPEKQPDLDAFSEKGNFI